MKKVLAFLAALAVTGVSVVALAQTANVFYNGFNPTTGYNGVQGVPVGVGVLPVLDATTSCGTLATVNASVVGGGGIFQFTANATTCTVKVNIPTISPLTAPVAAPNGLYCVIADETTPADTLKQTAHTTTSCTFTGTVVSGDKILVEINAF